MCGIYGFIGKSEKHREALHLFEILAVKTEVRGTDATGYYLLTEDIAHSDKAPQAASDFWKERDVTDFSMTPEIMIGHNRKATVGDPQNNENNHPFTNDRFGFIHNGDVSGDTNQVDVPVESECDSERLFKYIVEREPHYRNTVQAIKDAIITFDTGAMACAMVDKEKKTLHLFRNAGRPLVYIFDGYLNLIVFASNRSILEQAYEEAGLPINRKRIRSILAGQVVSFNTEVSLEVEIEKDEEEKIVYDETGTPKMIEIVKNRHKEMVYKLRAPLMGLKNWKRYHEEYGFEEDDFGKEFEMNEEKFKLHGFNYKDSNGKPIIAKKIEDNSTHYFSKEEIENVEFVEIIVPE